MSEESKKLHPNEGIKTRSNYLRGTIAEGLADLSTGQLATDDLQLIKFHGSYQQDDRDIRAERRGKKLEKAYSFMIRIRVPGGVATPKQWLETDRMAHQYANGTIKLTTRQAFQFHGIIKTNLKQTVKEINDTAMDTIAACGDVNRNVMCNPNPFQSQTHDVDIHANDLSFVAIVEEGKIVGYNVAVGGGMGMTHGAEDTFPRLADIIGFCTPEQAVDVSEKIVLVQRDFGNRVERKNARLKYTINDRSAEWFLGKVNEYLGYDLQPAREYKFDTNGDRFGWVHGADGRSHYTLFVQGGRVLDTDDYKLMTALREIAKVHDGDFRLTANQNLIIANVSSWSRAEVERLIKHYGLDKAGTESGLRRSSIACVALPTCALALTEAERYLPTVITELEEVLEKSGLRHDEIVIRMTGCPNGCGRPFLAEIGFVGRAPGKYNIYLGGGHAGDRLSKLYREAYPEDKLVELLTPIIEDYGKARNEGEKFGDFVIRAGYVEATENGPDFHKNIKKEAFA